MIRETAKIVLCVDCSRKSQSIVLYDLEFKRIIDKSYREDALSSHLLADFVDLCKKNQISPQDLCLLALVSGPGSFTGIRTAFSMIKTLAAELGLKIFVANNFELARFEAGKSFPVVLGAGKNDYFVSLDEDYSNPNTNYFSLEAPAAVYEFQEKNTSLLLLNYLLASETPKYNFEEIMPYYLREPSIGKASIV